MLCRDFNCTPSEAARELRHNPYIWDVIDADQYRQAYHAVDRWESMTPEQRKGQAEPEGHWVERVNRNNQRQLRIEIEERKAALERKGRA